jgi:2-methylisocitrate lyase-like PEP mutase family enzyme
LNLLVVRDLGLTVGDIEGLGVRRISVGGAFALAAWGGFMRAAQTLKSDGSFAGLTGSAAYAEINDFLAADLRKREGLAQAKAN